MGQSGLGPTEQAQYLLKCVNSILFSQLSQSVFDPMTFHLIKPRPPFSSFTMCELTISKYYKDNFKLTRITMSSLIVDSETPTRCSILLSAEVDSRFFSKTFWPNNISVSLIIFTVPPLISSHPSIPFYPKSPSSIHIPKLFPLPSMFPTPSPKTSIPFPDYWLIVCHLYN